MKTIVHSFGTDLSWTEPLPEKLGGKFENNFIVLKKTLLQTSVMQLAAVRDYVLIK